MTKINPDNIRGIYVPYRLLSGDIHVYYDDVKDFVEDYLSFFSNIQDATETQLKKSVETRCDLMFGDKCKETVRGRNSRVFLS